MKQVIKTILLSIAGLLLITVNARAQWTIVTVPTKNNLNSISLLDESSGWIVGDKGTMLSLSSGLWISSQTVTDENLFSVFLISSSDGWAVGSHGTILHMKDKRWVKVASPTRQDLYSVCFSSADKGYAVGNNGTFLSYNNGIWEMAERFTPGHFYALAIKNNQLFMAGGRENISVPIMVADYSDTYRFTKVHDPGYYEITGLALPENGNGWAVGRPGTILRLDGTGWKKVDTGEKLQSLKSIYFADKDAGITVGYGGTILTYSTDGWQKEESPVTEGLNGTFITGSTYYAVGNNGTVIRLKRSIPDPPGEENDPYPIALGSYPNPSSGVLNITIPEKVSGKGIVTVLNSMGQTVIMKELDSGMQGSTDQISTVGLSNGLYIVNILSNGQIIASGKFVVKH